MHCRMSSGVTDDPDAVGVISGADAAAELAGADESLIGFLLVHCLAGNFLVLELLPGELRERVAATQFFFNNGRQHSFFF